MDLQLVVWLTLAAIAGACLSLLVFSSLSRRPHVSDEIPDVVELAHELAALKKQVRRAYMSRVREGEGGAANNSLPIQAPPELQAVESPPASSQDLKARLRDAVFSRKH